MDVQPIHICFSLILLSLVVEATIFSSNDTLTELRQPRVSGRMVKVYSGTRPEPVYCPKEGFQADPVNCAVFYRCVKGASNKYTAFRFQCGPGTVFDPDTEVCNHPRSTKRSECGGIAMPQNEPPNDKKNENDIDGTQNELPSPITSKPIVSDLGNSSYVTSYPWATSQPQITQSSSSANPWMSTQDNKNSQVSTSATQTNRQDGDQCTTDGFMGDSENCRKFYRCVGNQRGGFIRYEFSCSESTIWDDDAQSCNHPWAVQRRRCGRGNSDNTSGTNEQLSKNQEPPTNTVQQQLQISYGDKVSQTQSQISNGPVIQNQTQIHYGSGDNKKQDNSQVKQNQTQISNGSAISQTQTQISNSNNGVQTQLQIDHSKEASQSQIQEYQTTSKSTTVSTTSNTYEQDEGYGQQPNAPNLQDSKNECTESGFMGDKNDCKKFYRCVDNGKGGFTKYEFSCGEGTVWDTSIEACNHAWAVKECGGKAPQSSSQSTTASTTKLTSTTASTSTDSPTDEDGGDVGYGNQNQNPEPERTSTTTTTQQSPAITASPSESSDDSCKSSGFMGDSKDCKKFYRCVDNGKGSYTRYEFKCGEGTVWDPSIEACNHPWAVEKCGGSSTDINKVDTTSTSTESSVITTVTLIQTTQSSSENVDYDSGYGQQQTQSSTTSTSTTTQSSGFNEGNECNSNGFMGDKNDCKKFYRCVDNGNGKYTRYEFSCGEGTVWDPKIDACNHAWAVEKCGGDTSGDVNKETTSNPQPTMGDEQISTTSSNQKETDRTTQSSPGTSSTEKPETTTKPSSTTECSQEGFMGDSNDCKKFYRCVDNGRGGFIKYEFSCGEGTVWDSEINSCNHENSVKTCNSGSSSQSQNVTEGSPESTTNNAATTSAQTTEANNSTEKPSTKPSNGNSCTQEGFMGDKNDCKKFYRCVDNGQGGFIKYEFSCGEGTVWDQEIVGCNHPNSNKHCGGSGGQLPGTEPNRENDESYTETTSETSLSTADNSQTTVASQKPQNSEDKCTSEGFFGNSNDCRKFYRCVDNGKGGYTKYEFDCGEGTVWDQEIQACNHESSESTCSKGTNGSTQTNKPPPDNTGDSTTTPSGESQQPTQKPETPPKESGDECKSEGFYANSNNCKKFYRCVDNGKGGFTKYDFSCGDGTVWVQEIQACDHDDGETSCGTQSQSSPASESPQNSSTTSSPSSDSASTQKPQNDENPNSNESSPSSSTPSPSSEKCESEGFHPDKNDCKRFYRCVDDGNGGYTKYDFTCGEGTAWDTDIQTCNHINEVKSCQASYQEDGQAQPVQNDENGASSTSTTTSSSSQSTTEASKPSNKDTCEQEGYYGNSQDCTKFYRCVDNGNGGLTKYDFTCGEGTIWDQDLTTCNHPQDVNNPSCQQADNSGGSSSDSSSTTSSSSTSDSSQQSSSTTESSSGSSDCSQGSTKKPDNKKVNCTEAGYYPDPDDCKKFYRCVDWDGDGQKFSVYHFECGEGTIWDPALDTCNHEESVYPPRDCSSGSQSQNENVPQETTTKESSTTDDGTTTEQTTSQESNTTEQTTTTEKSTTSEETTTTEKSTTSEQTTTTEQSTTSDQTTTTEKSTTQEETTTTEKSTTSEHTTTTEQSTTSESEHTTSEHTTEQTTTEQSTTSEHTTTQQSTTSEQTTTEQTTTSEQTTQHQTTQESTTEQTTEHTTSQQTATEESTTTESTTQHSDNTEQTTSATEDDKTTTTEQSTTQQSTTEESTENQTESNNTTENTTSMSTTEESDNSTTESSQDNNSTTEDNQESVTQGESSTTESTTESSSSNKDCPETEDDQNLFVCPTSFRRHPKYCNMFYQCTEDDDTHDVQIATFRCPNNTIYDESKTQCVEEKKADKKCEGEIAQKRRVKRLDALHKEPIVVTNERLKCPTGGHFPFEKQECSPAFLKCEKAKSGKIRGFVYQCPKGHVYWSVSRRCEPKSYLKDCKQSYNDWDGRWEIPIERRNVAK